MAEEPKWRQLLGKPAGALPPNVVQKVVLPLLAVLLLLLVYFTSRGSGPEEDLLDGIESEAVDQGAFDQFLSRMLRDREQAALEQQIAADRAAAARAA